MSTVDRMVPAAHAIARREVAKHGIDHDDVLSDAMYGLALADQRCEPGRPLAPYARRVMEGEVMHGKRSRGGMRADQPHKTPLRVISLDSATVLHETLADERDIDPAVMVERRELWRRVDALLDARGRVVVRLRYQWDLSQQEIADLIGVSQMHVSRILRAALSRLEAGVV